LGKKLYIGSSLAISIDYVVYYLIIR